MMMQWFINEVRERFEKTDQRIEGLKLSAKDHDLILRVEKLEGELKAMKARLGKQQKQEQGPS